MIHIIMPMAGNGVRFKNGEYKIIKPLIEVDSIPMFLRAYHSISNISHVPHFVIKDADNEGSSFENTIKKFIPKAQVHCLPEETNGAAETVFKVLEMIPSNDSILVLDCDLEFSSSDYLSFVDSDYSKLAGALVTFESNDEKFSYVDCKDGFAVKIAEKKVISSKAVCGAYFFPRASLFAESFSTLDKRDDELYISKIVDDLLRRKVRFKVFAVDEYKSFGTPQDLKTI